MIPSSLTITQSLDEPRHCDQAAEIFYEAFQLKIHHLEMFAGSREQALRVLRRSFCAEMGFFALRGEDLIGVIGMEHADGRRLLQTTPQILREEFGRFGGFWRQAWMGLAHSYQHPHPGEMRIDSLAVAPQGRGQGLGTLLLERVFEEARRNGCKAVTLEVVDTNPRARQLYERLGFKVIKEEWYGPLTRKAGLSGAAYMRKDLRGA